MKECVFLSNNQDGIIQNYWMMHFLNATDVLTNRVNCSGSTFNLTLFWRVVWDLRTQWCLFVATGALFSAAMLQTQYIASQLSHNTDTSPKPILSVLKSWVWLNKKIFHYIYKYMYLPRSELSGHCATVVVMCVYVVFEIDAWSWPGSVIYHDSMTNI